MAHTQQSSALENEPLITKTADVGAEVGKDVVALDGVGRELLAPLG
jgi:hypothetical protein